MLPQINPCFFEEQIVSQKDLVLLAFFERPGSATDQIKQLENLKLQFSSQLTICLGEHLYLNWFKEKFNFNGTPFYLFLSNGQEMQRIYGHNSEFELKQEVDGLLSLNRAR